MKMKTFFVGFTSLILSCFTFHPLFATNTIPIMTTIIGDDDGGAGLKLIADANCEVTVLEMVRAINLQRYPINEGTPLVEGEPFFLPSNYPPMALQYTIGDVSGTLLINNFTYGGTQDGPDGPEETFYALITLTIDVNDACREAGEEGAFHLSYEYHLVDLSNVAIDDSPFPYPLCQYRSSDDAFSCSFFDYCPVQEGRGDPTCDDSDWTTMTGSYVVQCYQHCIPEGGRSGEGQNFRNAAPNNSIASTEVQISPNPFNDRIEVVIQGISSFPPQSFEIYSIHGELLDRIPVNMEDGFSNSTTLSLGHLPAGVYFLRVNQGEKNQTLKLIKQ